MAGLLQAGLCSLLQPERRLSFLADASVPARATINPWLMTPPQLVLSVSLPLSSSLGPSLLTEHLRLGRISHDTWHTLQVTEPEGSGSIQPVAWCHFIIPTEVSPRVIISKGFPLYSSHLARKNHWPESQSRISTPPPVLWTKIVVDTAPQIHNVHIWNVSFQRGLEVSWTSNLSTAVHVGAARMSVLQEGLLPNIQTPNPKQNPCRA